MGSDRITCLMVERLQNRSGLNPDVGGKNIGISPSDCSRIFL